jgi:hypothetical protein
MERAEQGEDGKERGQPCIEPAVARKLVNRRKYMGNEHIARVYPDTPDSVQNQRLFPGFTAPPNPYSEIIQGRTA